MTSRRDFLKTTALGATLATGLSQPASAAPVAPQAADATAARRRVTRRHRNVFNGDTCVYFYNPEIYHPESDRYSAKAIHRYVDRLADSGIDTFAINANASRAWYPSKVIPTILDGYKRGDREHFRGHAICAGVTEPAAIEKFLDDSVVFLNRYLDLVEGGVDWLAETAKACRRRGISPWVSIRMNDMHGMKNFEGSYFNLPLLGRKEMRLQRSAYSPTQYLPAYREGLNYERREVRELMFAQIREVVEDYDFDGLELDWWRNPLCCEPNATPETVAMMNDWFRSIRALTERRARATGRPFTLGFRIPGRLAPLRSIGIDVATLCREGTLDWIVPSHFWRTAWEMPLDTLRQEVGESVAILAGMEDGVNWMPTRGASGTPERTMRYLSASREHLRANAAGKLVLGADGLEWYNFFVTDQMKIPGLAADYAAMREMPDLEKLRGQPKHYAFADSGGMFLQIPFEGVSQLPVILERGWQRAFRLPMCAEPANQGLELVVQVILKAGDTFAWLPVSVNGCWPQREFTRSDRLLFPCGPFTHHVAAHTGYEFRFPVSLLREGWNEVAVENGGDQSITLVGLELAVRQTG
jgi:hypothetical protein